MIGNRDLIALPAPPGAGAFTLLELLVSVAIIAILAAVALPNFLEAQTRAKVSRARSDLRTLALAVEAYHVDNNAYPIDGSRTDDKQLSGFAPTTMTSPVSYLASLPRDPFPLPTAVAATPDNNLFTALSFFGYRYQNNKYKFNAPVNPLGEQLEARHNQYSGLYSIYSPGPDKNLGPTYSVTIAGGTIDPNVPYDPTNGTISPGDVLYYPKSPPIARQ